MRQRSSYRSPSKPHAVQECLQPGTLISSVAISHDINTNYSQVAADLPRQPCRVTSGVRTTATHAQGTVNGASNSLSPPVFGRCPGVQTLFSSSGYCLALYEGADGMLSAYWAKYRTMTSSDAGR
jgi:hypothetical protein